MKCWDKKIYIANRTGKEIDDYNNEISSFSTPFPINCNVQPLSGSSDIMAYGEKIRLMQKTLVDFSYWNGKINVGDVAYLNGITPTGETVNGEKANYRVESILPQNLKLVVYFEKI